MAKGGVKGLGRVGSISPCTPPLAEEEEEEKEELGGRPGGGVVVGAGENTAPLSTPEKKG